MKKYTLIVVSVIAIGISAIVGSCNVENDCSLFLSGTIKHESIDWSDGASVPADYANADGETVGWCPMGTQLQGVTGIWYRNNSTASVMYNLGNVDLGNVDLGSVQSFDASMADSDVCDSPMIVGDVWVIDCKDGYVKFKVKSVEDINSADWGVGVDYEFSTTTTFS